MIARVELGVSEAVRPGLGPRNFGELERVAVRRIRDALVAGEAALADRIPEVGGAGRRGRDFVKDPEARGGRIQKLVTGVVVGLSLARGSSPWGLGRSLRRSQNRKGQRRTEKSDRSEDHPVSIKVGWGLVAARDHGDIASLDGRSRDRRQVARRSPLRREGRRARKATRQAVVEPQALLPGVALLCARSAPCCGDLSEDHLPTAFP